MMPGLAPGITSLAPELAIKEVNGRT